MFEKLLANLPYNPTLRKQIAYYAGRLRREQALRRAGLVFMVLAFMVQLFAFLSPLEPTAALTSSPVTSKSPAVQPCNPAVASLGAQACVVPTLAIANLTQRLPNASSATAQPNDVLVYRLLASNQGQQSALQFTIQADLRDALDYAEVVDLSGGSLTNAGLISWPAATIKAGGTQSHRVTLRVKNPLPNHFDNLITSVYGNTVSVAVPLPPGLAPISLVSSQTKVPQAGPGEGVALVAALVIVAGYFFARSRLLVDESMIVVQESTSGRL